MDYNARMYDASLGRFIQPDTIIPGQTNPQTFNRYSYVVNNPIMFTDPTGHAACDEDGNCWQRASDPMPHQSKTLSEVHVHHVDVTGPPEQLKKSTNTGDLSIIDYYLMGWQNYFSDLDIATNPDMLYWDRVKSSLRNEGWILLHVAAIELGVAIIVIASEAIAAAAGTGAAICESNAECQQEAGTIVEDASSISSDGITTVIGRFPENMELAKEIGANWLNTPKEIWNNLPEGGWSRNLQWLQEAVIRGDTFMVASDIANAHEGSGFAKELEYLKGLGYTISINGDYLFPPIK
jgi:hypothetical protein